MRSNRLSLILGFTLAINSFTAYSDSTPKLSSGSVIENSSPSDWRVPKQDDLIYLQLEVGRVVFELANDFAPNHVTNLRQLLSDKYFDDLAVIRSHDNYVVQWGDQFAEESNAKSTGTAKEKITGEFYRSRKNLGFNPIDSNDAYADEVGFSNGFAVGANDEQAWLVHCYGALGVGRGNEADSGNATSLYMVSGHAPRHLDRNITVIGRAIQGMEHLSSLPRGTGSLGFYESREEITPIESIRLGTEIPKERQLRVEIMRTDTETFNAYVNSRTYRQHEWFLDEVGRIGICNVGVPIRTANSGN